MKHTRVTDAFLLGAAAKAGGGLMALDISTLCGLKLTHASLMEVAATNWGALTELSCHLTFTKAELEALLHAAPLLCECRSTVGVAGVDAGP